MPSKIETSLTPDQLRDFFSRCAQLKGTKLKDIATLAEEFGIDISLMSARSFKQGAFADYLEELKAKRDTAETVAEIAKNGLSLTDAAASAFAAKLFDASLTVSTDEIGGKKANNISLAIARLKTGDRADVLAETRIAEIQQKMDLREFDAVQAAIQHANEIKAIHADKSLDGAQRTERVRKLLFGEKPADFKPVTDKGAQAE